MFEFILFVCSFFLSTKWTSEVRPFPIMLVKLAFYTPNAGFCLNNAQIMIILKIIHLWFETCFDLFWRKIHTRHPAALYVNWIKWKTFFCFYLLLCNIVYFLQMCLVLYNTTLALCLFLLWRILYVFHDVLNAFIACFTAILHLFASSKLGRNIIFSWLGHIFYCDRTQVSRILPLLQQ